MQERQPSRTALGAAGYRAAHQTIDGGKIFADPFAVPILGPDGGAIIAGLSGDPGQQPARLFMAARSRFAEDCLAEAVSRGVRQVVILGAGLDTFALRNPHAGLGLRIFEVDHPATQAWKLRRLNEAGLGAPASVAFVSVDFERQTLRPRLLTAGFDPERPAFFMWLGVVPYLGREAIAATLRDIVAAPNAEVAFDYSEPLENYPPERRPGMVALSARAAGSGEPWLSHFDPAEIARALSAAGFTDQEDLGLAEIMIRYLEMDPGQVPRGPGPHVIRARRVTPAAAS